MSFQENLLRKIELEKLASRVMASIGTEHQHQPVDKEAMRQLLELSPYKYQRERDLDLYVKPGTDRLKMILVLDNELPIFHSTVKDVVTRRSPRTLEMWKISTIRHILVDSDIKVSTRGQSVEAILKDALAQLDLAYTDKDIDVLARAGMAWLAGGEAGEVEKTLVMFAALLGYRRPPERFGLDRTVCYGVAAAGPGKEALFGPLVIYRPADNSLFWINEPLSLSNREQMEFFRSLAEGRASVAVTGDAVFEKLRNNVLALPARVLPV